MDIGKLTGWIRRMIPEDRKALRLRGERESEKARFFKDDPERLAMALGCARAAVLIWRGLDEDGWRLEEAEDLQRELEGKVAALQATEQERFLVETRRWAVVHGVATQEEVASLRPGFLFEGLWKVLVQKSGANFWRHSDGIPQRRDPDPGTMWVLTSLVMKFREVPGVETAELNKTFRVRRNDTGHVSWTGEVVVNAAWGRRTFTIEV